MKFLTATLKCSKNTLQHLSKMTTLPIQTCVLNVVIRFFLPPQALEKENGVDG